VPINVGASTLLAGDAGETAPRTCPGKTTHRGDNSDNEDNDGDRQISNVIAAEATATASRAQDSILFMIRIFSKSEADFAFLFLRVVILVKHLDE